ncbi:Crp/Fnr family transcriptional regulator [Dehalobacter sp. TBBPA1]|uniref:Crp/Fnr family transcriptional regulator n=1 Tax=Dehalobacter sp. TBBPA1 TaxID=3235037 RepID=UPI0034A14498
MDDRMMDDNIKRKIPDILIPETFNRIEHLGMYTHLANTRTFTKGSIVLGQGAESNSIVYVQSGCLSVGIGMEDGHNKFLFNITEGCIGMTTFLSEYHELQIHAVKTSTVCFFPIAQVLKIFHDDEQVILDILQNILSKVYYFMAHARDLNYSRPSSRVFRLLYNLCIHEGKFVGGSYVITSKLTQKAIADITGTHYVTVCKLFNILEKQEVLKKVKNKIYIYDLEKLKSLINEVVEY